LGGPGSLAAVEAVLVGELARNFGLTPRFSDAHSPFLSVGDAPRVAQSA
jgi:lipoyl(octanoyl) transferase